MKSSIKRIFSIALLLMLTLDSVPCKFLESKLITLAEDEAIATITKDSEQDLLDAIKILIKNGGTINLNIRKYFVILTA